MSRAVLKLEPRLDTAGAGALAGAILEHRGTDLELDASRVTHFGAMGLQVIRAAAKSWHGAGRELTLSGLSTECGDHLRLLGFCEDDICKWENG